MAIFKVTNTNASGAGSLADAVAQANATGAADTIVFAKSLNGQTIDLSATPLILTNQITINGDVNGDGDADITLSGGGSSMITVNGGAKASLKSLNLTGGYMDSSNLGSAAAAIENNGDLKLIYSSVSGNTVYSASSGISGDASATIVNRGTMSVTQSAFGSNSNTGGSGYYAGYMGYQPGGKGGDAGTIINFGTLSLDKALFDFNFSTGGSGGNGGGYSISEGFDGGPGGDAAGAVLNLGTVSGDYEQNSNTAIGGAGGQGGIGNPDGADGATGDASDGLLNKDGGTGSLALVNLGTMNADTETVANGQMFFGLAGGDTITGSGNVFIHGGTGNDTLTAGGASQVIGGMGDDTIFVTGVTGGNWDGGQGSDTLMLLTDGALAATGVAIDLRDLAVTINGGVFWDFENVTATIAKDTLTGDAGANILNGIDGNDRIEGGAGADDLLGGGGKDTVTYSGSSVGVKVNLATGTGSGGDAAGDHLDGFENATGSAFDDTLRGDGAVNVLAGGAGDDTLLGGAGADDLRGGGGHDVMAGGSGHDKYFLSNTAESSDTVVHFSVAVDKLVIDASVFGGGLTAGMAITDGVFTNSLDGQALDADDRFMLVADLGDLYWDADGAGVADSVLIAHLTHIPALRAEDFLVV